MSRTREGVSDDEEFRGKEVRVHRQGKGGKSFAITLPEEIGKEWEGKDLQTCRIGDALLLMPATVWKPKVGELDFQENDPDSMEYQIITAYLNNYRRIYLTFKDSSKDCIERLERLPGKLLGVSPSIKGALSRREIKMSTEVEPITNILVDMHQNVQTIHKINQDIFSKLEASSASEVAAVEAVENDIDKKSFLVKRIFCIILSSLYLAKFAGVDDLPKIIHYENLNSNLERAGDLQSHVFRELNRLVNTFGKEQLKKMMQSKNPAYSFREYHNAAQRMLDDAFSNQLTEITKIIKTKKQDIGPEAFRERGEYITKNQMKAITDLTNQYSDLRCLDFRIWGLTGSSTNVSESWLNMRGPTIKSIGKGEKAKLPLANSNQPAKDRKD